MEQTDQVPGTPCLFEDLPGFGTLPEAVRRDLAAICRLRTYEAGQTIAQAGAPSDVIGVVRDGILRLQKTLPDGRQHVVGLLVAGDMFGRLFDGPLHFPVEAATDAKVLTFRRAAFETILLRSSELDRLMLRHLMDDLDRARAWMIILANPKVRGRLAGFLLLLCRRFHRVDQLVAIKGPTIRLRIPISRPDLAHLLGARVESISRALHALADDGLIEILLPDLVEIRRIGALAEEAGEPDLAGPALMPDHGAGRTASG